ncbi:hypothetical protein CUMW_000490 [Citrus unshiu]|nr:hypothetical protein CUMW_000490 [Citrus unshiu]
MALTVSFALRLFFFPVIAALSQQKEEFIFNGFNETKTNQGLITRERASILKPSGALRLTDNAHNVIGHAFYNKPIQMLDKSTSLSSKPNASSFSTCFVFQIVTPNSGQGGFGLAFTVSPQPSFPGGKAEHYLGILNSTNDHKPSNHLFAIELVNVTICPMNKKNKLSFHFGKPSQPLLSLPLDLSPAFQETMYVGFSASTGRKVSSHFILGWSFSMNGAAPSLNLSQLPSLPIERSSSNSFSLQIKILIAALSTVAVILLGTLLIFKLYRRIAQFEILEDWELDCPHRFRYSDLYTATKGFKQSEVIGTGGFGEVYKGVLPTRMREFAAEIESLGRLRHKHLVNLQGWCKRKRDLLLVYDYIPNGSLDSLLFDNENFVLSWEQRFNIIKGIAAGLLYLHEEWEQVVIHRDVKSGNVLIDADMNARLGDFGLARLFDHGKISHTTNVVGTIGYIAPELARTGKASCSTDVFAYGVLLLEIATGRRPIDSDHFILVDWVLEFQHLGQVLDVVDPNLGSSYVVEEMELVLQLGLLCSHQKAEARPTMRQVLRYLNGDELLPIIDNWSSLDSQRSEMNSRYLEIISTDNITTSQLSSSFGVISSNSIEAGSSFIFQGFNGGATNLSLQGAEIIKPSGALKLTNRSRYVIGHAFYVKPIQMFDTSASPSPNASSFSTTFVFEISTPRSGRGGHGLAFLLAPSTKLPGAQPEHYLGILNSTNNGEPSNHILIVEFDTVNGFNDKAENQGNHVGIGINTMFSNRSEPASYYINGTDHKEEMTLESGEPIQAWIEYDGEQKVLNVTISPAEIGKPMRPLISFGVNLTGYIKETMYVGFSASTGEKSSSHYILGWSFSLNGVAPALNVSELPKPPKEKEPSSYNPKILALIVSLCLVTFLLLGTLVFFLIYRKWSNSETLEDWEKDCPHRFRYKDLYAATKGFKESEVIGIGGFGSVYKGVLPTTGGEVAVKKITRNSLQGMREFAAEIESLGRLRHKNLVNLHGWCKQKNDLLLVYEYIPNGSLDTLLFKPKDGSVLDWEQRFNIVKGIASGLLYLHEEWEQVVIHRDVKPSNALIDAEMNARLGDFGLARLYDHGGMPHTTNVVGTFGYIAPELTQTGKASTSSDVFAYGILLLEVATGRRPIGSGDLLLVEWVRECHQLGRILDVADPLLNSSYVVKEMELVLKLGLMCSHKTQFRPTMRQVMRYLSGEKQLRFNNDWGSIDYRQGFDEFSSRTFDEISTGTFKSSHRSSSIV